MTVETEPSIEASVGCTATGCDSSDSTKSRIRGAVIALRKEQTELIRVRGSESVGVEA